MRFVLPALLLSAAVATGEITVRSPVNDKEALLGTWEGMNAAEDGYLVRMVLESGDKGYLIWPKYFASESSRNNRYRFLGQLQKLELKNGRLKLLFRRVSSERADDGQGNGYDSIEIDGRVVGWRGNDEMLSGTARVRVADRYHTFKITLWKGEHIRQLAADARRAADDLELAMKPGPIGSREDALAILRKNGAIVDGPPGRMGEGTRIVAAEWNDEWRRWIVELQKPNGDSARLSVDVAESSYGYLLPDEMR